MTLLEGTIQPSLPLLGHDYTPSSPIHGKYIAGWIGRRLLEPQFWPLKLEQSNLLITLRLVMVLLFRSNHLQGLGFIATRSMISQMLNPEFLLCELLGLRMKLIEIQ